MMDSNDPSESDSVPFLDPNAPPDDSAALSMKLSVFSANFSTEEVMVHAEDFPDLKEGDILQIFNPREKRYPRLVLQVSSKSIYPQNALAKPLHRNTLYMDQSIADTFYFQNFKEVKVNINPPPQFLLLDTVELVFRDQYMGRSEMWRLKSKLVKCGCVHLNKKIELCGGSLRCHINEMWSKDAEVGKVACGKVTEDTKVIFRSPTAMVYLFIQMSSEMWEFDSMGTILFEKAVQGFLAELFNRWKSDNSSHEVTIVMFSRCIYDAKSKSEFPHHMRDCLQVGGKKGVIYEDFYRVVVQNERFDDWEPTLLQLRKIYTNYKDTILNYHRDPNPGAREDDDDPEIEIPPARLSNSKQGNFLEVLNMSLNTFENHYLNRNLDRTGQQSIVLTAGSGVFEVDWSLSQITKQRILDNGVGSDLICVGEPPYHAVPLLQFHNSEAEGVEEVSMPHWINLSFYKDKATASFYAGSFQPRSNALARLVAEATITEPFIDPNHDASDDSKVFGPVRPVSNKKLPQVETSAAEKALNNLSLISDSQNYNHPSVAAASGQAVSHLVPTEMVGESFDHESIKKHLLRPGRTLMNPFDPSQTTVKVTSNRRRWTHIFPSKAAANPSNPEAAKRTEEEPAALPDALPKNDGVDWKSLTTPALLPITTDFFPDLESLRKDYNFNEFCYSPQEINSATGSKFGLNCAEAFAELVSQRFAHGFQLIIFPEGTQPPGGKDIRSKGQGKKAGGGRTTKNCKDLDRLFNIESGRNLYHHWLSIGRIYHKITYNQEIQEILVNKNQPLQPLADEKQDYRYRFQAPDNDTYEVSWAEFRTQKLENFNWNSVDHYVITRGDSEYTLTNQQKYWRLKLHLVPHSAYASYTKKIVDGSPTCDIYPLDVQPQEELENFAKFMEVCLNRLKRKIKPPGGASSATNPNPAGGESPAKPLTLETPLPEIAKAMSFSKPDGVPLLTKSNVPAASASNVQLFVTVDAVNWLFQAIPELDNSIPNALEILQKMADKKLIRTVTPGIKIYYGYQLLEFVLPKPKSSWGASTQPDPEEDNNWVEVGFETDLLNPENRRVSSQITILDVDQSNVSERPEWGHLKYQGSYNPTRAYELSLLWIVATGSLVADLIQSWARKAQSLNFNLFPVPGDPFALPITKNSDPIRGPIFIEMDYDSLFSKFGEISDDSLFQFKKAISRKFGFVSCGLVGKSPNQKEKYFSTQHQYIHCTGNMYILIPTKKDSGRSDAISTPQKPKQLEHGDLGGTSLEKRQEDPLKYQHRYLKMTKPSYDHSQTGFLWSWNFMISRRWKQTCNSGATGDIPFMDKMLHDFRMFCSNKDGRLENFWLEFSNSAEPVLA